jgi:hypothetical protein
MSEFRPSWLTDDDNKEPTPRGRLGWLYWVIGLLGLACVCNVLLAVLRFATLMASRHG